MVSMADWCTNLTLDESPLRGENVTLIELDSWYGVARTQDHYRMKTTNFKDHTFLRQSIVRQIGNTNPVFLRLTGSLNQEISHKVVSTRLDLKKKQHLISHTHKKWEITSTFHRLPMMVWIFYGNRFLKLDPAPIALHNANWLTRFSGVSELSPTNTGFSKSLHTWFMHHLERYKHSVFKGRHLECPWPGWHLLIVFLDDMWHVD